MPYQDRVITETYRDKRYEEDLTKMFFEAARKLEMATFSPNLMSVRVAFSAVKTFSESLVYSKQYLEQYKNDVRNVLDDIQTVLYGDYRLQSVVRKATEYNSKISKINGETILSNGQNILNVLSNILFLVKQWAYMEGLFLPKPIQKKQGTEGIENTLMQ